MGLTKEEVQGIVRQELGAVVPKLMDGIVEACLAAMFLKLGLAEELPEELKKRVLEAEAQVKKEKA